MTSPKAPAVAEPPIVPRDRHPPTRPRAMLLGLNVVAGVPADDSLGKPARDSRATLSLPGGSPCFVFGSTLRRAPGASLWDFDYRRNPRAFPDLGLAIAQAHDMNSTETER